MRAPCWHAILVFDLVVFLGSGFKRMCEPPFFPASSSNRGPRFWMAFDLPQWSKWFACTNDIVKAFLLDGFPPLHFKPSSPHFPLIPTTLVLTEAGQDPVSLWAHDARGWGANRRLAILAPLEKQKNGNLDMKRPLDVFACQRLSKVDAWAFDPYQVLGEV